MRFKAIDGVWFFAAVISKAQADGSGNPGATHTITGPRTGTTYYGTMKVATGRPVNVPDSDAKGVRAKFRTNTDATIDIIIDGYLVEER